MLSRALAFLGHGRALEANYIVLKLVIGIAVMLPGTRLQILPLNALQWYISDMAIAIPFLVIGMTQLLGLVANIRGYRWSWLPRAIGAGAGIGMWGWILVASINLGALGSFSFCVSITGIVASTFLAWKAVNRLPIPGAMGLP